MGDDQVRGPVVLDALDVLDSISELDQLVNGSLNERIPETHSPLLPGRRQTGECYWCRRRFWVLNYISELE